VSGVVGIKNANRPAGLLLGLTARLSSPVVTSAPPGVLEDEKDWEG